MVTRINDREQNPILRTYDIFKGKTLSREVHPMFISQKYQQIFLNLEGGGGGGGGTINTNWIFLLSVNSKPTPENISTWSYMKI